MSNKRTSDLTFKNYLDDTDLIQVESQAFENFKVSASELKRSDKIFFDSTDINLSIPVSDNVQDLLRNLVGYFGDPAEESIFEELDAPQIFDVAPINERDNDNNYADYNTLTEALLDNAFKRYGTSINGKLGQAVTLRVNSDSRAMDPEIVIDGLDLSHIKIEKRDEDFPRLQISSQFQPTVNDGEVYLFRFINGAKSPIFSDLTVKYNTDNVKFALVSGKGSVFRTNKDGGGKLLYMDAIGRISGGITIRDNADFYGFFTARCEDELITIENSSMMYENQINYSGSSSLVCDKFLLSNNSQVFLDVSKQYYDVNGSGVSSVVFSQDTDLGMDESESILFDLDTNTKASFILKESPDASFSGSTSITGFNRTGVVTNGSSLSIDGTLAQNSVDRTPLEVSDFSVFSSTNLNLTSNLETAKIQAVNNSKCSSKYMRADTKDERVSVGSYFNSSLCIDLLSGIESIIISGGDSTELLYFESTNASFIGIPQDLTTNAGGTFLFNNIVTDEWTASGLISGVK